MKLTQEKKNKLAAISLFAASFFLPFGYDALFKLIMELSGSYWIADIIFYCISGVFFGLYFYFSGISPLSEIRDIFLNVYKNKIKHYGNKKKS
jgi:H+/Cl- antiporter ClcA